MGLSNDLDTCIPGTSFLWRQALWLPTWQVAVYPDTEQEANIIKIAYKLETVKNLLGKSIQVTSWLRPSRYNEWRAPYGVGGAINSSHMKGMAVDFSVIGMACDDVRAFLEPKLEEMQIRMERKPKSNWVHIDVSPVQTSRYFFP